MRSLICFWYRFVFEEFGKLETKSYLTLRGRHMPKLTKTEMLISAYEKCELLTISLHVYLYLFFFFFFWSLRISRLLLLPVPVLRTRI